MNDSLSTALDRRTSRLKASLARHRLVFLQLGTGFEVLREGLLTSIADAVLNVGETHIEATLDAGSVLVISDVESLALHGQSNYTLSRLRDQVFSLLDLGHQVCLVSTAPRVSFGNVPGSSLLEDAALVLPGILHEEEVSLDIQSRPLWRLPQVSFGEPDADLLSALLTELGSGVLSALDHCLFEIDPRSSTGLSFLNDREAEALLGAGLVTVAADGAVELTDRHTLRELKDAVTQVIGKTTTAPPDLAAVSEGLWFIERTLRTALRLKVLETEGTRWRSVIVGGLASEVLRRAQLDTSLTAVSIQEIRDPLEWLTISELIDIITSAKIGGGLGVQSHLWHRFREQVVPVRNRLSHMRLLKSRDQETISIWVNIVRQRFK